MALEVCRAFEEAFGGYGEELGWVGRGVGAEKIFVVIVEVLLELFVVGGEDLGPGGVHGAALEVGGAVDGAFLGVELVGELVEDDVFAVGVAGGACEDVAPGDDDGASVPGLAEGDAGVFLHEEAVGGALAGREEGVGVHEDGAEFGVEALGGAVEHEDARLCGDGDADLVGDREAVAALEVFLVEEDVDEADELSALVGGELVGVGDVAAQVRLPLGWERFGAESGVAAFAEAEHWGW